MNRFDSTGHPLFLPSLAYIDADGEQRFYGEWVPCTIDHYYTLARSDLSAIYATRTDPGQVVMTSWCDRDSGVPTVAAVDHWFYGKRQPSEFFRIAPTSLTPGA